MGKPARAVAWGGLGLMAAALVAMAGAQQPAWFPPPKAFVNLGSAATPAEQAQLRSALVRDLVASDNTAGMGPLAAAEAGSVADAVELRRVPLGALGEGYLATYNSSHMCGATGNCPLALFSPTPGGGYLATDLFGWGFAAVPGAGPVPEIYIAAREGGSHDSVARLRWNGSAFVPDGEEETRNAETVVAQAGQPTFPLPDWSGAAPAAGGLAPAQWERVRPAMQAALERRMAPAAAAAALDRSRSSQRQIVNDVTAIVVQAGACDALANCPLFLFRSQPGAAAEPMLLDGVPGWAIAVGFYQPDVFGGRLLLMEATLARRTAGDRVTLIHYREVPADRFGPDRLVADGCEAASGAIAAAPEAWHPAGLALTPGCGTVPAPQSAIRVDRTPMQTVLRDGNAAIWGASNFATACSQQLYRWQQDHWMRQPPPGDAIGLFGGIAADRAGGVIANWTDCGDHDFQTWQRGDATRVLPPASPLPPSAAIRTGLGLIVPIGGDAWRNGAFPPGHEPGLALWTAGQPLRRVYTFEPDQMLPQPLGAGAPGGPMPRFIGRVQGLTDSSGATWFWDTTLLRGVVVLRAGAFHAIAALPGFPARPINQLWFWDANHLAGQAVPPEGSDLRQPLYQIDIRSTAAELVNPPQAGAFDQVAAVFHDGADLYVIAASGGGPAHPEALWRQRSGAWQEVIPQLNSVCCAGPRAWAATAAGLWIAAYPAGVWYLPNAGPAVLVDWTHGLPLSGGITTLLALSPTELLAVTPNQTAEFTTASVLRARPVALDFTPAPVSGRLARDASLNLWGLVGDALGRWDGHAWTVVPFPVGVVRNHLSGAATDNQGRIWLLPNCSMGPVATYRPASGAWQVFNDYRNALARQDPQLSFEHPGLYLNPARGPYGQMAFIGPCGGLNYYNGRRWRLWNPSPLRRLLPGNGVDSQPGFDAGGSLLINVGDRTGGQNTWRWTGAAWVRLQQAQPLPPANFRPWLDQYPPAPPPDCNTPWPESMQFDSLGRAWWTAQGNLFVGIAGRCHIVLSAAAVQPFLDGRLLNSVALDRGGGALVQTVPGSSYFTVPAWGAAPTASVRLRSAAGRLRAEFSATPARGVLYSWRLDGGRWSAPQAAATTTLGGLAPGRHTLEVVAFDPAAAARPQPASAAFTLPAARGQ